MSDYTLEHKELSSFNGILVHYSYSFYMEKSEVQLQKKDFTKVNQIPAPLQVLVSEERSTSNSGVPCAFLSGVVGYISAHLQAA